MSNRDLVLVIVLALALLAGAAWLFVKSGEDAPRKGDFVDAGEEPVIRLDTLLARKRKPGPAPLPGTPAAGKGGDAAPILDLSERRTGEARYLSKLNIPAWKRKKTVGQWADTDAYRSLLAPPEIASVHPTYAETLDRKADEIARAAGFNRAFGQVIEQAMSSGALREAEKVFADGKGDLAAALARFTELLDRSENLYLRAMAAAYILRIHDLRGDKARADAARANLAVLSAQVAKEAFPDAVARMGAESPAVKRAMDALAGGELMKLTVPQGEANP